MALTTVQNAMIGVVNSLTTTGGDVYGGLYGFRNRIINGAMGIWQRGTTYALTNSNAYGSVDRWSFLQSTTANGVANQVASGLTGFQYALKLGRNNGATTTGAVQMTQVVETSNSIDLAGNSVTISFWAKAGANFSASSSNLGIYVATGTGTDQSSSSFIVSGWTGNSAILNTTQSITTTWTRYSFTASVSSTATQIGVNLYYTPVGTAGADDNVYITGVQLEKGSTATSFDYRPYGTELQLCQRYYQKYTSIAAGDGICFGGYGFPQSSSIYRLPGSFPIPFRGTPTFSYSNLSVSTSGGTQSTVSSSAGMGANTTGFDLNLNVTVTTGTPYFLRATAGNNGYVDFSAEL